MWALQLNPMTANAETVVPIVCAETPEQLYEFMKAETVEPYQDGRWYKVFRKDGPLEWMNAPVNGQAFVGIPAIVDFGNEECWVNDARIAYQSFVSNMRRI
jgi:hypothetical protein